MATAVEGLFSALGTSSTSNNPTRPPSIEVIDVDLLSDDEVQVIESRRPSRPAASSSRRPESSTANRITETILLIDDSDDETSSSTIARRERRRIFSPPPPRQNPPFVMVPPVPRVPPQFAGQTSSIGRPGRRTGPPAPVHAVERSFDFDFGRSRPNSPAAGPSSQHQASSSSSRPADQTNGTGTHAAPPSQHVPTLGLGGALIAMNRARVAAERSGRAAPGSGGFFTVLTDGFRRAVRSSAFSIVPGTEPEPEDPFDEGIQDYLDNMRGRDRYRPPLKEKEQYKPFYTHPTPAEPGFTHDFAPDASSESAPSFPPSSKSAPIVIVDEEDESKPDEETKISTTLVCARCYDPLVLNAGLTGADASQRRIWALRCGHLLDGKCVSQIGQPAPAVDRKGKGKAKEEIPYGEAPTSRSQRESTTDAEEPSAETSGIRSRLRSRAQSGTQDANTDLLPPSPNSRKRKRGPTKASANKKTKVEDVFEWQCPVPGCSKAHASVKINGGWGPEKERQMKKGSRPITVSLADLELSPRGVIPVFV